MTATIAAAVGWVRAHPTTKGVEKYRLGYGYSWSQLCVALVFHALGATRSAPSANLARAQSHLLPGTASLPLPAGAFPWFDYGKFGHVGFGIGSNTFISATRFTNNLGTALGTLTPQQYAAASGGRYLGYSWDFCGQTFNGTSTAGTGSVTPVAAPHGEENMAVKIWHYENLDEFIVIDHLNMTYRIIPKGSLEEAGLKNDIAAGVARTDEIADPAWGQNFGNGQFTQISKPATASTGGVTNLQPVLDAEAKTLAAVQAIKIPVPPTKFVAAP